MRHPTLSLASVEFYTDLSYYITLVFDLCNEVSVSIISMKNLFHNMHLLPDSPGLLECPVGQAGCIHLLSSQVKKIQLLGKLSVYSTLVKCPFGFCLETNFSICENQKNLGKLHCAIRTTSECQFHRRSIGTTMTRYPNSFPGKEFLQKRL